MQDRYAADVGDFLTYGLLRWLVAADDDHDGLSLGVHWFLVPDESHNGDGKHVSYLEPGNVIGERLRAIDPDLHDRMRWVASTARSIEQVERSGALPEGTASFPDRLSFAGFDPIDRAGRLAHRARWMAESRAVLDGCDVVFVDPDNGMRPTDHREPRHRDKAVKHVYVDELRGFAERGQALIVYQHADRSGPVDEQAVRRLAQLTEATCRPPIGVVRANRGSARMFLVVGDGHVGDRLASRIAALPHSRWHLELTATGCR